MKFLFKFIKKIVISCFTIIAFNLMVVPLNFALPINFVSILFFIFFGFISIPFFAILILYFL